VSPKREVRVEPPYNPLDKKNLGVSVADAMLVRPVEKLPPEEPFIGAGIYAIYYAGNFPAYKPIAEKNAKKKFAQPIYVGKAVPAGARIGGALDSNPGTVLYGRLRQHAASIKRTKKLDIKDFFCRYLVVDDIWIPLGETLLIQGFSPLWNKVVEGFGIHDPGSGRHGQKLSAWDVLHGGRTWGGKLKPGKQTEEEILEAIRAFHEKVD
jgi:Eco29kI restriction endonuclease